MTLLSGDLRSQRAQRAEMSPGPPDTVRTMGIRNYLIEGIWCTGKTSACNELRRRGYHTVSGDDELAYWGHPTTGEPLDSSAFEHWIWDVDKVRAVVADQTHDASFFCGGSRNFAHFIDLFDEVFVLEVDLETLNERLALRSEADWGGLPSDGEANARLQHSTQSSIPKRGIRVDATAPITQVVDSILEGAGLASP